MTRFAPHFLLAAVALALVGCAKPKKVVEMPDCVFPQTAVKAPAWTCSQGVVEGVAVWAAGSFQKTAAGTAFQQDQATLVARARLAERMQAVVTAGVTSAITTTGSGSSETVDLLRTSTSKSITAATLVGSRAYGTAYAPDGTMFVLVGMDEASAKRVVEQAVATSMNNNRAQWQQVKGAQAQAELSAEVYKLGIQSMR